MSLQVGSFFPGGSSLTVVSLWSQELNLLLGLDSLIALSLAPLVQVHLQTRIRKGAVCVRA